MPNIQKKIKASERKLNLSDEELERRRKNAQELVKSGKLGGAEHGKLGGRPRKKRASEEVAEAAREHINSIVAAFVDALDVDQAPYVRLQAAREWLKIENQEAELQMKEDKALQDATKDELLDEFVRLYLKFGPSADGRIVEAEVVNDESPRAIGTGSEGEGT